MEQLDPFGGSPSQGIGEDQLAKGVGLQICWQVRSNHSGRSRSRDKPCGPKHRTVLMPGAALATARATRVRPPGTGGYGYPIMAN